jgi:hypothetical protein
MALKELGEQRNHALVETHLTIDYMMLRHDYMIHKVGQPLVYIFNSVVLPKGSLYYSRVEYLIQLFVEHGLTLKWLSDTMGPKKTGLPPVDPEQMPDDPMNLNQLQVTFYLYIYGLVLASISFIVELLIPLLRTRIKYYKIECSLQSIQSKTRDFIN